MRSPNPPRRSARGRTSLALLIAPFMLTGCDDPHVAPPTTKSPSPIQMAPEGAYPDGTAFALGGVPIMKEDIDKFLPLMDMIDPHLVKASQRRAAVANLVLPIASGHALDPVAREEAFQKAQTILASVKETGVFPPDSPPANFLTGSFKDVGLIPFNAAMSMEPGTYSDLLEAPGSWVFFKLVATNVEEGMPFEAQTELTIQRYDVFYLPMEGGVELLQAGIDTLPLEIVDPEWEHIIPAINLYQSRQLPRTLPMLRNALQDSLQVALIACSLAFPSAIYAAPSQDSAPAAESAQDAEEKATEWPAPRDEAALKKSVAKVRAARSEDMEAAGRSEIQLEGAAAAPLLMRAIAKERKDDARARLCDALDLVTTKAHTRLLAESLDHKSPDFRVYLMRRLAVLGDRGLRERAEAILADVTAKAADPRKAKKLHEDEVNRASVLALSTGSPKGLPACIAIAGSKAWPAWREPMRAAAAQAKTSGTEVAEALEAMLIPGAKPTLADRAAALRLIAYAGHEEHARCVLASLDDTANHIKVAAVNALRMIIDGDAPLDKLSSFDAIGRANKWKARL